MSSGNQPVEDEEEDLTMLASGIQGKLPPKYWVWTVWRCDTDLWWKLTFPWRPQFNINILCDPKQKQNVNLWEGELVELHRFDLILSFMFGVILRLNNQISQHKQRIIEDRYIIHMIKLHVDSNNS